MSILVLLPREGMFLKDGREWGGSDSGRARSLDWPMPSTLLGALRTACGRVDEADRGRPYDKVDWASLAAGTALGRSLVLRRAWAAEWQLSHRVWPVPADALFLESGVVRLDPQRPSQVGGALGRDDDPARDALWYPVVDDPAKPERAPLLWPEQRFIAWLQGAKAGADARHGFALPRHERTHVSIQSGTQAAEEGMLFAHDVVETLDATRTDAGLQHVEWAIACEFLGSRAAAPLTVTIGGDRRLARAEQVPPTLFAMPDSLRKAFDDYPFRGIRLIVVSPAVFEQGWLPDGFVREGEAYRGTVPGILGPVVLRAAMVPRPSHVSGWDMAVGAAKSTTRLVPAGAVYHVEKEAGPFTTDEAQSLWLAAVGQRTGEGFGRVVPGVWKSSGAVV